jgi:hypothetical protein
MKAQEYLDSLIEECKIFSEKSIEYKDVYAKLFPDAKDNNDVKAQILSMNDDSLLEYFKASQVMLDVQTVFTKVASFIYLCKHIDIELDLSKIQEVNRLADFISTYIPFNTEFVTNSEGNIKEKQSKEFNKKFAEFKNSIGKVIDIV